jgi:predicted small lipoprotein YifL
MSHVSGILDSTPWRTGALASCLVAALAGCGQKGALFIPTGPEAADRATLPQTLMPPFGRSEVPAASDAPTSPRQP